METEINNTAFWIEAKDGFNINCSDNYHCSNCGNREKFATLYCSYCGKKMINKEPLYWKPYRR